MQGNLDLKETDATKILDDTAKGAVNRRRAGPHRFLPLMLVNRTPLDSILHP